MVSKWYHILDLQASVEQTGLSRRGSEAVVRRYLQGDWAYKIHVNILEVILTIAALIGGIKYILFLIRAR